MAAGQSFESGHDVRWYDSIDRQLPAIDKNGPAVAATPRMRSVSTDFARPQRQPSAARQDSRVIRTG